MTYGILAVALIGASVAVAMWAARRLPDPAARRRHWRATGIAAVVLVALTAIFDNLMIRAGLVEYDLSGASGILLGVAPIEDFSYAIACALGVPGLWLLLTRRERAHG